MTLTRLFEPRSVAVVGASSTPGKIGNEVVANLAGFDGPVYPVNPNGEGTLGGRPFAPSVPDVDDEVDLALCCVPAPAVPEVLADCATAGVGAAVVYAGGFAEAGEEARQAAAVEAARAGGVDVLGPNTSGFAVPRRELYASFVGGVDDLGDGNVAVVAQSGGVAHALAFQAARAGLGLSAMVGLGNAATVGFRPVVEHLDADDATDAVLLHVEGTDDARGLVETCRTASTPVVAYKVGRTDVDEFAASHTGALTGEHARYEAAFRQYGVPTVGSTTALLDAGAALATAPEPDGPRVGLVTAQAGPGIVATDRLQAAGAEFPSLAPETLSTVREHLPGVTRADNPVDAGRPMPAFGDVVRAVARDPSTDLVLVYQVYEAALGYPVEALDGLAAETGTPVVFATDGPDPAVAEGLAALREAGVPAYRTPERGADAVAALVEHARLDRSGRDAGRPGGGSAGSDPSDRDGPRPDRSDREPGMAGANEPDPVAAVRAAGRRRLGEAAAKRLLADAGVAVPGFDLADDPGTAVEAAGRVGYPVVAKVHSPAVAHKSDWADGAGVALDLAGPGEVRAAAAEILDAADERGLDADVLVEAARDRAAGTEVIVGGTRDASFGPSVLVGTGGVLAEVHDDVAHRLAPVTRREARRAVGELRAAPLLEGHRSRPAADLDSLAATVRAVGELLVEREAVTEVDLNPVLATPDGAVALDALVVLADPDGANEDVAGDGAGEGGPEVADRGPGGEGSP